MPESIRIGTKSFPIGEGTYIMGILNVTPDSFSDGGKHNNPEKAAEHALRMIEEGADIIDVGGESTRPDYTMIPAEEEIVRVVPVIKAIRRSTDVPISIDTYKSRVAAAACEAGADMVNDVWGLLYDPDMAYTVKKYDAAVCITHNANNSTHNANNSTHNANNSTHNANYITNGPGNELSYSELAEGLKESLSIAKRAGIQDDRIIIDPGIGFGKTYEMNLWLINNLERLHEFGYPLLLGASRKSVIGLTLNEPVGSRLEGTIVTSVIAVMKGCQILRVHDVRENVRAVRMAEAVLNSGK
jgi:dihydropteroate synthase